MAMIQIPHKAHNELNPTSQAAVREKMGQFLLHVYESLSADLRLVCLSNGNCPLV
jgi:hypothetical protein